MIDIFNSGGDIHMATAMDVLKKTKESIDKETRKKAKAVNFGFVYGMFPPKFQAYALEKFDLKLKLSEAKDYRSGYFRKYKGLLPWHRRVEAFVRQNGFIDSIFGRRRHLPQAMPERLQDCTDCDGQDSTCFLCGGTGYVSVGGSADEWVQREAVRQAVNSPIQSAGSDLLLWIIGLIASYSAPWKFKIDRERVFGVGSAHDSMLFECHRSYAKEFKEGIMWTVANLPFKKYFNFEMRVPVLMDVNVYADCWEGQELVLP